MDTNTADPHPLARLFTTEGVVLSYTEGADPCPVALGFIDHLSDWKDVAAPVATQGERRIEMVLRFVLDARPLAACRKTMPKRVFFKGPLCVTLSDTGRVVDATVRSLDACDTQHGRFVAVPASKPRWRYTGLAADAERATLAWARTSLVPLLPGPLGAFAQRRTKEAEVYAGRASEERALIDKGFFPEWNTPERRAGTVAYQERRAADALDEAARMRELALLCARAGGTGMTPAEIAGVAERARAATARHAAAAQEAARKAQEAIQAAEAARARLEAEKAARERLEAAAPALLAALVGLLEHAGRDPEADDDVIAAHDAARAAVAQAKGAE